MNYDENNFQTITFNGVNANDITDNLTIRVASVNGADPESVTRTGTLQITALKEFPTSVYEFSRGVITKYNGNGGNVVIPSTIWDEPVKGIGYRAFMGKDLYSVIIGNGVTHIADNAFPAIV